MKRLGASAGLLGNQFAWQVEFRAQSHTITVHEETPESD